MHTVITGSNPIVVSFYSSYLTMLGMENESYNSISVGLKRAIVNSDISNIFVIIETREDMEVFGRLKLSVDTNLKTLIIISTSEDITKIVTSPKQLVLKHKDITQSLSGDLAKLQLCKPYMQEKNEIRTPEKTLKHIQAMLLKGRIALPVKHDCGLNLLAALEDNDISFKVIDNMTKTDPALHSGIIKMANSVYFSGAFSNVTDVEKALVRVGMANVKVYLINFINKSLAANKELIFVDEISESVERSLLTASLCYVLAVSFKVSSPVTMFSIGLMSYIGEIFMYAAISDYFFSGSEFSDDERKEYVKLTNSLGLHLSGKLLQKWKFSDDYTLPIINTSRLTKNKCMNETKLLHLAVNMLDFHATGERDDKLDDALSNIELCLSDSHLEALRNDATKHLCVVNAILS